jgi:ribose transport system ATP-binding protein
MAENIVEMEHISKSFPGVKALDDVSFSLKAGECMALLGENGAGKSTLMKILSGVYRRDSGTIRVFGKEVQEINPNIAKRLGIAIIHQELNMCQHLTVAENIFLGREICSKGGVLDQNEMVRRTQAILDELSVDLDPNALVGDLAVSKQQMVEIAKALSINAKILIMDEPTSSLTSKEINELFRIITKLKNEGHGIVYISHRLEELRYIVDRVTIMRDGKFILQGVFKDFTMDQIVASMVGREIKEKFPHVVVPAGKTIFEVKNLNSGKMVHNVSFSVREGEILGIAGLMGAGRTETTRAIFGVDPKESGEIILEGKDILIRRPEDAIRQGVVLVPEDRKKDGLCVKLPVRENIALPNLDLLCHYGVVDLKAEKEMVDKAVKGLSIKLPNGEVLASSLSGGNQQKVVVAKWLSRNSRVVIFDEPTRGIDVAAKVEIYMLMNDLKKKGIAVVFVSSEMPEILGMADRIIVMCEGYVTGELLRQDASQEKILTLATTFQKKVG